MIVTHKIKLDLIRRGNTPRLNAVQGDINTRVIEASLYSDGTAWTVPDGAAASLRYCKPDGTKGLYDALPDGTQAWSVSGNTVSMTMAPQMLSAAGLVLAQVVLVLENEVLATFAFQILVARNPADGEVESTDYVNWLQETQQGLIDKALAQAKQSGEFDGEPGRPLLLLNGKDAENDADVYILTMLSTGLIKKYTIKNLEETDSVAVGDSVCVSVRNTTKNTTAMIYGRVLEISGTDIAIKPYGVLDSGYTPHIGDNGNWFIGPEDTGVRAEGTTGEAGATPSIGSDGNWYIGTENTGVRAKGINGDDGEEGLSIYTTSEDTEEPDWLFGINSVIAPNRPILTGDLLLTPGGKVFRVCNVLDDSIDATYFTTIRGQDGYAPVRGTDYWTEADREEISADAADAAKEALMSAGAFVKANQGAANVGKILSVGSDGNLVLVDMPEGGTGGDVVGVVDDSNNILLTGALADGIYTLKYENEDGTYTEIGTLEVGAIVTYTIKQNLTGVTSDNTKTTVREGESLTVTITANAGYALSDVKVIMGGTDITSSVVKGGVITIPAVTGNVVITAVAAEVNYTNLAKPGDENWKTNIRVNSGNVEVAAEGWITTNYIAASAGDTIYIKNLDVKSALNGSNNGRVVPYANSGDATALGTINPNAANYSEQFATDENGVTSYVLCESSNGQIAAYASLTCFRLVGQLTGTAEDVIITVNEPIE